MNGASPIYCNAGPLMALGKLNRLELLADLYPRVQIPEVVYNEVVVDGLARGEADAAVVRSFWRQQQWPVISVQEAVLRAYQPHVTLGGGECAVLALTLTTPGALALLDDALARREARRMQVQLRHAGNTTARTTGWHFEPPATDSPAPRYRLATGHLDQCCVVPEGDCKFAAVISCARQIVRSCTSVSKLGRVPAGLPGGYGGAGAEGGV